MAIAHEVHLGLNNLYSLHVL